MARLQRPGFGLPLEHLPPWNASHTQERFPHAIADFFATNGVTCREQRMLDFINQITDKPKWWEKIGDEEILARWRNEACGSENEQLTSAAHLDAKSFTYCIQELRDKAAYLGKYDLIHVLDVDATVLKSDVEQSDTLWTSLREAVRLLEDVPDRLKDWHPGSNGLVLDLLHPSLFPLHFGKSRVLPMSTVPLATCAQFTGAGETVPSLVSPEEAQLARKTGWDNYTSLKPWGSYQWLPSEISCTAEGKAKIDSYVNNLHPEVHDKLYEVLEQTVDKAVPLWNECLSWFHDRTRICVESAGFEDLIAPAYSGLPDGNSSDGSEGEREHGDISVDERRRQRESDQEEHEHEYKRNHPEECLLLQPSVGDNAYTSIEQRISNDNLKRVDLRSDFPDGLQVIFKLATIHLTPDNPAYDGSNWHVEGALNEHICATALFYYDSVNIADTYLEFRLHMDTGALTMKPGQDEYAAVELMYGIKNEEAAIQRLGHVLTRPGRWLAFPNVMQHRVSPFGLQDRSKPGHRKILAMFLVDPHIKILSTANVPPQRRDWWADEVRKLSPFSELPVELFDRIIDDVEDFPIGWEEACETREALMAERGKATEEYNEMLEEDTFFFCEH